MFFNILKKDLKRKKSMNIILFIFITLCATFMASSVGNLLSILNAIDYFGIQTNISDYFIFKADENNYEFEIWLESDQYVTDSQKETRIVVNSDNLRLSDGQLQRACICRSLINNPKMIFADEPTGSLNKQASVDVTEKTFNTGYKEIIALAKFYDVSADYLIGLTDNRKYRNVEIDELSISYDAIDVLKSRKLNNRLISELLSQPDFPQLLSSMEVYIDRKILPQMNTMNAIYELAESVIR